MNEIRVCPACGYARGFHLSFLPDGDKAKVVLICPGCGQSYPFGWTVEVEGDGVLTEGAVYPSRES
jgi:hypothetical protein